MNTHRRRDAVHQLVMRHGRLHSADIASRLEVSPATVRRDLAALERRGLVERTWGGAQVRSTVKYLTDFASAADHQAGAKRAIAARAARMVSAGMVIGLSGGTTCTELARWLRGQDVTVLTNAINVAMELYNHGRTRVIMTGGQLNSHSYELIGESATSHLHEHRLDLCFVGCSGIRPDFGFSMRDMPEAAVARAFASVSEATVVVADHSKVGRATLARFVPLAEVDALITDEALDPTWQAALELTVPRVVRASGTDVHEEQGGFR